MLCGLGVLGIKRIADSESPPSAAAETIVIPIGGCWVVCSPITLWPLVFLGI